MALDLTKNYTKIAGTDKVSTIDDTNSTQIDEIEADMTLIETDAGTKDTAIGLNTAKETNATHTGEVTGAGALTIADNVIDEAKLKLDEAATNDYVLTADSAKTGGMKWAAVSGTGDVVGPASAVDGRIAVFDNTTGKLIKDGGKLISELSSSYFNVKDYGAVGDGSADDTNAIDAAITAAVASIESFGGGTVFFPKGNYKRTTTLEAPVGIRITGENLRSSVLWYTGTDIAIKTTGHYGEIDHIHITSLDPATTNHLMASNVGVGSGKVGIQIEKTDWNIHHNTISYFNDASKYAVGIKTHNTLCFSQTIENNYIRYCWGGISLEDTVTDESVLDNSIFDVEKYGISIGYNWDTTTQTGITGDNFRIKGNVIENVCRGYSTGGGVGAGYGIFVADGAVVVIEENYIEDVHAQAGSTAYGIYIDGETDAHVLEVTINKNNIATGFAGTKYNVYLDHCWYGSAEGNHFEGIVGGFYGTANCYWFKTGINFFTSAVAGVLFVNKTCFNRDHTFLIEDKKGWTPVSDTWAYASATTITVPSGAATYYKKGDKITLVANSVTLYAYIVNVADELLTVAGNALTNHTFSSVKFSKIENPQGFPDWFAYTPTTVCSGSMTYTSVTVNKSRFKISGNTCTYSFSLAGTTGGTASYAIRVSVPVNNLDNYTFAAGAGIYNNGAWANIANVSLATTGYCSFYLTGTANFTLGADQRVAATAIYEF